MSDDARYLRDKLGVRLTAVAIGVTDWDIWNWAVREGEPDSDQAARLAVARQAFELVTANDSDAVGRAWFMGMNPDLGDESPALCIRDGRGDDVIAAAKHFREQG